MSSGETRASRTSHQRRQHVTNSGRGENGELTAQTSAVPYVSHNEDEMDIDMGKNVPAVHEVLNEEQLNSMSM